MPRARAPYVYPGILAATLLLGCSSGGKPSAAPEWTPANAKSELHPTTITRAASSGALTTHAAETSGEAVGIACATCHQGSDAAPSLADRARKERGPNAERTMHTELALAHGDLECTSCHTAESPELLHSANGAKFSITDSMRLCSQCHGLIRKAYDHGAHGGMRGYWDLQRGPRERNTCIACHNPHSPKHPKVIPVPGPKDKRVYRRIHDGSMIGQRFGKDQHE